MSLYETPSSSWLSRIPSSRKDGLPIWITTITVIIALSTLYIGAHNFYYIFSYNLGDIYFEKDFFQFPYQATCEILAATLLLFSLRFKSPVLLIVPLLVTTSAVCAVIFSIFDKYFILQSLFFGWAPVSGMVIFPYHLIGIIAPWVLETAALHFTMHLTNYGSALLFLGFLTYIYKQHSATLATAEKKAVKSSDKAGTSRIRRDLGISLAGVALAGAAVMTLLHMHNQKIEQARAKLGEGRCTYLASGGYFCGTGRGKE